MADTEVSEAIARSVIMGLWSRVALVLAAAAVLVAPRPEEDRYTTRFDNVNVEAVLRNERILRRYVDCALDKGPCTAEGRELKKRIPDALHNDCAKCSDVQRRQARRVLEFLAKHKRRYWDLLAQKYDPDGTFRKKHGIQD